MDNNNFNSIREYDWTKRWAGSYTFISCSNFGWQYHYSMVKKFGTGFEATLHIHKEGVVSCFMPMSELSRIGETIKQRLIKDPAIAEECLNNVKNLTDKLLPLMAEMTDTIPNWEIYSRFLDYYDEYLPNHVFMKEMIDYLPAEMINDLIDKFADARAHSEPVYSESERFSRSIMKAIGTKENIDHNLLTCLTRSELEAYLREGKLPDLEKLKERFALSAIFYHFEKESILIGNDAVAVERAVISQHRSDAKEIKGRTGYGGKAKGVCRIILDPYDHGRFDDGDVLVTGMTRPEFIPLMKKASAFVTDAGGMLCHAAITAREMKKPCVIGTEVATKVLKDGDVIEVDADKGLVIIK